MKGQTTAMTHLSERIRALLDGDPRVTEKYMFGGLTFLPSLALGPIADHLAMIRGQLF